LIKGILTNENLFTPLGEIYYSYVNAGVTKGWKYHKEMYLRLQCLSGRVLFQFEDFNGDSLEIILEIENQKIIIVPPKIKFAFKGLDETNLIVNYASMIHNENEVVRL